MRPIEALTLLANLLAFAGLVLPLPPAMRWMRHTMPVALLVAAAQILAEGQRWQMIPAYALTGLFFLIWLRRAAATGRRHPLQGRTQQRIHRLAVGTTVGLGALALLASIALPNVFPIFGFPHPTGPYAIGTLTYHWIDASRSEAFGAHPQDRRELMVQIWYPAAAGSSSRRAPYMQDADAVTSAFARIHHLPAFVFRHFKYITTNAAPSAPVAGARAEYPVLLFLEGVTGFRQMNTYQVEELASHGYVVAAIDQPGAAAAIVFPDGRQVAGMTLAQVHASIDSSYMPDPSAPRQIGRVPTGIELIRYFAQDAVFALDQLAALNQSDPNRILSGKLDLRHAGAFGVSLGGIVVAQACRLEPRLRACLMMDAPMPVDVVISGLQQPSMWITRNAEDMRLERQQAGGWSETEILAHHTSMRAVYQSLPGAGYFVQVPGMFHANFTDVPAWSPWTTQMQLAGLIDGHRAHDIVNAYSLAFFDKHLSDQKAGQLDVPAALYPEVHFESRRP